MSTAHTPGPWVVDESNNNLVARDVTPYEYICEVSPSSFSVSDHGDEQEAANARLIASSPDLLEALEACLATLADERIGTCTYMEGVDIYSDFRNAADKARAAIAKARGEA